MNDGSFATSLEGSEGKLKITERRIDTPAFIPDPTEAFISQALDNRFTEISKSRGLRVGRKKITI